MVQQILLSEVPHQKSLQVHDCSVLLKMDDIQERSTADLSLRLQRS